MKIIKNQSKFFNTLLFIFIIYILLGVFLYFNQRSMLYHPNDQNFEQCSSFKDYQKINYNGTRFYFKHASTEKVIVFYHGNAGSTCDRSYLRLIFERFNASLVFVEYAGYSNDNRNPSKKLILKDVQNINDFIQDNSFTEVTIYGESIGAGAASYHSYIGKVNNLILITPFSRLIDVAQSKFVIYPVSLILKERYDNVEWLKNYENKVVIFHGDQDLVIPSRFSKRLYEKIPSNNKEYVLIEGKGHNDLWSSSVFINKLIERVEKLYN